MRNDDLLNTELPELEETMRAADERERQEAREGRVKVVQIALHSYALLALGSDGSIWRMEGDSWIPMKTPF